MKSIAGGLIARLAGDAEIRGTCTRVETREVSNSHLSQLNEVEPRYEIELFRQNKINNVKPAMIEHDDHDRQIRAMKQKWRTSHRKHVLRP